MTIQNVFLNLVGELQDLKLIDFGFARFLNQSPAKPDLDELNPFYLAPERFSGVCSIQTDLYSVGVMMYHLLYGELPWFLDISKKSGLDVIDSILAERDKELELTKEDKYELDDQLLNVIAKALSYDAEDRFRYPMAAASRPASACRRSGDRWLRWSRFRGHGCGRLPHR